MKRLFSVLITLFFLAASCSKAKPDGILSDKKMSDLMTEVYVLDSYLNTLPIDSGRKVMPVLYQNIFNKFKIDSARFSQNLDYYYGDPIALEKLNITVKDVLSGYEKEALRTDSVEHARVRDSINRVNRLEQWAAEMRDLILNVHLDSTTYTFEANNTTFFRPVESLHIYRHTLSKYGSSTSEEENIVMSPFIDTTLNEYDYKRYRTNIFLNQLK